MHWQIWSQCQNHWHGLVLSQNRVKISLHFWCPRLKAHQATYIRMCWKSSIMTSGNILTCMLHALMLCFWPRCKQQFLPTCCPSPGNGISQSKGTIHIERVLPMISLYWHLKKMWIEVLCYWDVCCDLSSSNYPIMPHHHLRIASHIGMAVGWLKELLSLIMVPIHDQSQTVQGMSMKTN